MATTARILSALSWVILGLSLGARATEVEREFIARAAIWLLLTCNLGEWAARWFARRAGELESED